MKELEKINDRAIRSQLRQILEDENDIREKVDDFINGGEIKSNMVQTFVGTPSDHVLDNLELNLGELNKVMLIIEATEKHYTDCMDIIRTLQKRSKAKVVWSFHLNGKDPKESEVMKIFSLANYS
ncbi:MAG: hypothetical protein ABEK17_01805 [Candidatus Aenigmatarchaeota archaeon]